MPCGGRLWRETEREREHCDCRRRGITVEGDCGGMPWRATEREREHCDCTGRGITVEGGCGGRMSGRGSTVTAEGEACLGGWRCLGGSGAASVGRRGCRRWRSFLLRRRRLLTGSQDLLYRLHLLVCILSGSLHGQLRSWMA